MVHVDVCVPASIAAAVKSVKDRLGSKKLYGFVNNAAVYQRDGNTKEDMIKTNVYGVKRMSEAFFR